MFLNLIQNGSLLSDKFVFFHEIDTRKIITGGPWSFNNCLLLIHQLREGENLEDIEFNAVDFWVRVHDLLPDETCASCSERTSKDVNHGSEYNREHKRNHRLAISGSRTSKVTYGGVDGAYYTTTRTRRTGTDGVDGIFLV
ncbi:hypothetical protein K2173_025017 [Erythroxylum novogranatense]|uniref:DUF4283 domain-containing protein n=1 Tax=Erythroxylum novogranatense TaxID=1862640 RepID=A0AAV8UGF8_9ROSI|nr:hypothetical protein K2173_025017 [Erythroxylum novogranatense]